MGAYKILQGWNGLQIRFAVIILIFLFAGLFAFALNHSAYAATTLPTKMNFQGRITNSSGNILANGTYNMRFKIFNAATAGTQQWAEDRLVSAGQGVVVTNGQFSVQLGSVTSLPASIFVSNSLYFEVELPTPASATTSSPVWTELPMAPRNQLATSAYAYNSETLDGLDSAAFGQLDQNNVFSGNNTFNGTLQGGSSLTLGTSGVLGSLILNDGNGQTGTIRMADTAGSYTYTIPVVTASDTFCMQTLANCGGGGGISTVGTFDGGTANATGATIVGSTIYLQSASASFAGLVNTATQTFAGDKTFNGTVTINNSSSFTGALSVGSGGNSATMSAGGLVLAGTARTSREVTLTPEYAGSTFRGDGTNNIGNLSSDFCSASERMNINTAVCAATGEEHNYYEWTTTQATAQDYDIYVKYRMPVDFDTGSLTNFAFSARGTTTAEVATVTMYQNGTQCITSGDVVTAANWQTYTSATPSLSTCTVNAGTQVVFKISLTATQNQTVYSGDIYFNYKGKF